MGWRDASKQKFQTKKRGETMSDKLYGIRLSKAIKAKVMELTGLKKTTFINDADTINAHIPPEMRRASRVTLQKMMSENSRPRIEQAEAYAHFLGISVDEIWWAKLYERGPAKVARSKSTMIPVFKMPFLRFSDDAA